MKLRAFSLLMSVLLFSSCILSYETIEIGHYREPVSLWDGPWMSYRIGASDDQVFNWVWGIKDFRDYQWGYEYKIKVKKKIILNPPLDSPSTEYTFVKVLSKEKADAETRFVLMLKEGRDIYFSNKNGEFNILDEIDFIINNSDIQENLETCIPISRSVNGIFSHLSEETLLLHQIEFEFDRDLAIEYLISLPGQQMPAEAEEWNESDFISYIKNINAGKR